VVVSGVGGGARPEQLALGETPNVAAKLQALAAPDSLLITAATRQLAEDSFVFEQAGPLALKGRSEPIATFRVLGVREAEHGSDAASAGATSPVVGRGAEIQLLTERWAQTKDGSGQVALLLGEAGIGKSRLVGLLREQIAADSGMCITFRCSPYFTNSALHPIITRLQQTLEFQREDTPDARLAKLERLLRRYRFADERAIPLFAALLSVPVPEGRFPALQLTPLQLKRQTADALAAWLVEETLQRPVLLVFEDLHWSDPSMLELLTLLIDQIPAVRMMLLLSFRPDFTPPWTARSYLSQLMLGRFSQSQAEELISQLLRGRTLPAEVVQHIVAKTDGVPLFVEELLKMILESGMVSAESGEYRLTGPLSGLAIPTTLQDSLMARLDRLAAAREIAQIGAALGREFSYELIRAVAPVDELALDHGLARLVEAELIYRRGQPPDIEYVFKHALIRDAAYQSLLKRRRVFFHDRIARVMEERFPEIRETEPELLAHHYTEAGLAEEAVGCWQRAAQRAIERSAYVEAIHHLDTALKLHESLPVTPQSVHRELLLLASYGLALTPTKGYAAPALEGIYARARELIRQIGDAPEILPLLNGLWSFYLVRAKYQPSRELGEQMLRLAEMSGSTVALIQANRALGVTLLYSGELEAGLVHIEKAVALYDPTEHCAFAFRLNGLDLGVSVLSFAAWGSWLRGRPARALQRTDEMLLIARDLDHPYNLAWVLVFSAWVHQFRRDVQQTRAQAEAAIALAKEQGFSLFQAMGRILRGWSLAMSGSAIEGIAELRQGMDDYRRTGAESSRMHWTVLLAEAYLAAGQIDQGLGVLDEAQSGQAGERYYEAELHRMRGELHLARAGSDARAAADAGRCFEQALDVARSQGATSLELRAAMSLNRVRRQQGRKEDARNVLARVYGGFSEGFDTADLQQAAALLKDGEQ
jgi:predicted ATPase